MKVNEKQIYSPRQAVLLYKKKTLNWYWHLLTSTWAYKIQCFLSPEGGLVPKSRFYRNN